MVYNRLEADDPDEMPKQVELDRQEYSRKNEKTNNRNGIGTLFGKVSLDRFSYEPLSEAREQQQKSFSPLERCLGIVAGNASPALAERVGRAAAGHTQRELLELLRREHRVGWSVNVLRRVTAAVSEGVAEHLHQAQKEQLLAWLRTADDSKGRRKITLAVGRDGIMLPMRNEKTYKEGAVATLTVYDRRSRRLGTIYLGQMPESYQTTLSEELTDQEEEAYRKAYQYLNNQKPHMDYREYRRRGLPIGSGITEAACKTVFTQRFKESGMSWGIEGGSTILTLRLATMSPIWDRVYGNYLASRPIPTLATKPPTSQGYYTKAA